MKPIFMALGIFVIWFKPACGDFESFVTEKLDEFPAWLLSNGLDPFPFSVSPLRAFTPASSRNLTINENISQVKLHGISRSPNVRFGEGDFDRGYLSIYHSIAQNFSVSGIHETWYSTSLIDNATAQGIWTANFNTTSEAYDHYYYVNFNLLSSGHLQIGTMGSSYPTYMNPEDIYFEGLSDNPALVEYNEEMISLLKSNLASTFANLDSQMITRAFGNYWMEIFSKFTAQDIIDHGQLTETGN